MLRIDFEVIHVKQPRLGCREVNGDIALYCPFGFPGGFVGKSQLIAGDFISTENKFKSSASMFKHQNKPQYGLISMFGNFNYEPKNKIKGDFWGK
jgi:hypothetical protein